MLTQSLEELDFADDLCLMAQKYQNMQEKMDKLASEARRLHNSQISTEQTEVMAILGKKQTHITRDLQHCFSHLHVRWGNQSRNWKARMYLYYFEASVEINS